MPVSKWVIGYLTVLKNQQRIRHLFNEITVMGNKEQVCDDEVGSSDVKELTSVDENLYPESVGSQVDDVLEQWYKSCLDWYDIWEEMHPQVLEHKEEYPDAELTMKLHEAEEAVKNEKAWLSLDELKNQVEQ